jgi:hypothetical protein
MAEIKYRGHKIKAVRPGWAYAPEVKVTRISDGWGLNTDTFNPRFKNSLGVWDTIWELRYWLDREIEKGRTYQPHTPRLVCPKCNQHVDPKTHVHCPYCGRNLWELRVRHGVKRKPGYRWCPKCQTNRSKHLSTEPKTQVYYCHECGTKLEPTFKNNCLELD